MAQEASVVKLDILETLLARQDGLLEHVLSTEPMEFKLNSFLSKIGRSPVGQLQLSVAPEAAVDTVYPLQDAYMIFRSSLNLGRRISAIASTKSNLLQYKTTVAAEHGTLIPRLLHY